LGWLQRGLRPLQPVVWRGDTPACGIVELQRGLRPLQPVVWRGDTPACGIVELQRGLRPLQPVEGVTGRGCPCPRAGLWEQAEPGWRSAADTQ